MNAPKLAFLLFGACAWAQTGPTVWVAPSLKSIRETDGPGAGAQARLFAGKGEYESFQIVVKAPGGSDLTNTRIKVSELRSADASTIAANNLSLFLEHYVTVRGGSTDWHKNNRPTRPGRYPDALIPVSAPENGAIATGAFRVRAGMNQPLWADIRVPAGAAAGEYSGTFTVSSDQGSAAGRISLRVWNFSLPAHPAIQSAFLIWQKDQVPIARTLLQNKVTPLSTSPETIRELAGSSGLTLAGLPFWSGADVSHCSMKPPPPVDAIRAAIARLPRGLEVVDYTADEVGNCRGLYPTIRKWGQALHQAGAKNLVTMAPVPELLDDGAGKGRSAVDIWAVLPEVYDAHTDAIRRAMAKGDAVWSYTTLVQDAYSPKWEIDFAPVNFRIMPGFLSQSLGLVGILYWRVDAWPADPWKEADTTGTYSSGDFPGEGMLVYPGRPAGVPGTVPSLRLKWIRDGMEDFDYVALLDRAGYGSWARSAVRRIAANWSDWTKDPESLEATRRQLGEKLDGLAAERGAPGGTPPSNPPISRKRKMPAR